MAGKTAFVIYRSVLFREVFSNILSGQGAKVRRYRVAEAPRSIPKDMGETTIVVEARSGDESTSRLIRQYLFPAEGATITIYAVDWVRDEIVEFRRRRRDAALLKKLRALGASPKHVRTSSAQPRL